MRKGLIVYATVSGNTELVCQQVIQVFEGDLACQIVNCNIATIAQVKSADFVIFACGTYSHGLLQRYMESFLKKNDDLDLEQKPCVAIGLGDAKYDHIYNMEAATWLSKFIDSHNGLQLVEALRINFSPVNQLDTKIKLWAEKLKNKLIDIHE